MCIRVNSEWHFYKHISELKRMECSGMVGSLGCEPSHFGRSAVPAVVCGSTCCLCSPSCRQHMSEWPHARPGASNPACCPELAGDEAVPADAVGHGVGCRPLPRIQRGEFPQKVVQSAGFFLCGGLCPPDEYHVWRWTPSASSFLCCLQERPPGSLSVCFFNQTLSYKCQIFQESGAFKASENVLQEILSVTAELLWPFQESSLFRAGCSSLMKKTAEEIFLINVHLPCSLFTHQLLLLHLGRTNICFAASCPENL